MVENIFVAGLDSLHLAQLQALKKAERYRFHSLITYEEIKCGQTFPVRSFIRRACQTLEEFAGSVDGVIGFWDFPVSTVLPYIRRQAGLAGPSLTSVLKCEHKYWSRLIQEEVVPELIPEFRVVNPFAGGAVEQCDLSFPFWLKPVKSVLSHLGFLVRDRIEFAACLETIREHIGRYARPFNYILGLADLPDEIRSVDGFHCIAESLISAGHQCTLEGYVLGGEIVVYGVVDSIREETESCSSFARYQYPSMLPAAVLDRMAAAAATVLLHAGYDNAPFNIEFYWNPATDTIALLEINTRISKSHCPLFKLVDGEYHHDVLIDVALGRQPHFPYRQGEYGVAAKFMLRRFQDGIVRRIPSPDAIERLKRTFPGCEVTIKIRSGMRLSDLRDQDSYSFEIAELFLGANTGEELLARYRQAVAMLPFAIEQIEVAA
ncbi:D-alanine--D-alanine ligase [bacterium]|nr:D-alanine--D-alanine ligase [bacterium]